MKVHPFQAVGFKLTQPVRPYNAGARGDLIGWQGETHKSKEVEVTAQDEVKVGHAVGRVVESAPTGSSTTLETEDPQLNEDPSDFKRRFQLGACTAPLRQGGVGAVRRALAQRDGDGREEAEAEPPCQYYRGGDAGRVPRLVVEGGASS